MKSFTFFLILSWIYHSRAAYKCASCISPDIKTLPTTHPYCAVNTWSLCLDEAQSSWNTADDEAKKHVSEVWSSLPASITPTDDCHAALKLWVCAAHMPVCEASTHGRGVCNTQFATIIEPKCPSIFLINSTAAQKLRVALDSSGVHNGSVISEDQGSCFHLDYNGPNYWNWLIGFGLCTIFAALSPLALNLQKSSINQNDLLPIHLQVPTWQQKKWLCACVILISGSLVDFVAYGLAPQSLLTPLGSLVLVWNMVVAHYYGEKIGKIEILATFVIGLGTILCIIYADHYTPNYSFADILNLWYTQRMAWYIVLVPLSAAAHMVRKIFKIFNAGLLYQVQVSQF